MYIYIYISAEKEGARDESSISTTYSTVFQNVRRNDTRARTILQINGSPRNGENTVYARSRHLISKFFN